MTGFLIQIYDPAIFYCTKIFLPHPSDQTSGALRMKEKTETYTMSHKYENTISVLILGIWESGGDPPPLHKMWGRG